MHSNHHGIRVRGHLSSEWATAWSEGLDVRLLASGAMLLSVPLRDQAALYGVLLRIRDMGLTLLSVTLVEPRHERDARRIR